MSVAMLAHRSNYTLAHRARANDLCPHACLMMSARRFPTTIIFHLIPRQTIGIVSSPKSGQRWVKDWAKDGLTRLIAWHGERLARIVRVGC